MRCLVTTAPSGSFEEARELAERFGLEAQPRADRVIPELVEAAGGAPVLVLSKGRADLVHQRRTFRASVGMGFLRLVRARQGETDPLVRAAGLRVGDAVIDATLGLAGDALVAAQATERSVVGFEASPVLAAFVTAGLRRLLVPGRAAAQRIEVRYADHRAALREMPDRSADVVLFDPMFRSAGDSAALFELVRALAEHAPLAPETLREARRVARRGVLVKDAPPGHELARLGLVLLPSRRSPRIMFGWADAQ
ncbi:MAG: class I SAM-dependent methyltransferase [Myxococcales bacterium]